MTPSATIRARQPCTSCSKDRPPARPTRRLWPCGTERLSYAELNARANRLAHLLLVRGATPGRLVSVSVARSADMVVSLLAVLKTGATYLPLDPAYPSQRLAFMLEDSGSSLGIAQSDTSATLRMPDSRVSLTEDAAAIAAQPASNPVCAGSASDRAYVIYTSGSTGHPKGVQITHGSVVNFLHALRERLQPKGSDVFFALASMSFDMSVLDMFLPLSFGASVAIATREVVGDPRRLLAAMQAAGATFMQATPSHWRMLVDSGLPPSPCLTALVGGDALPEDLALSLLARVGAVWNLYGPTETTVYSTMARYRGGKPLIGRPIANTRVYLLDPDANPVPVGEAGELHIAGDGLALGYLNRPELTAAKFVADPFADATSLRMYRTGDLARYTADGNIECLGRIDRQVKVRGYRIEPAEIEAALRLHPGIVDACVIDFVDASGERSLVAYYVPLRSGVSTARLRAHALARLPQYMVPSHFIRIAALPLSPSGKIERYALPPPENAELAPPSFETAPRDEVEAAVAQIWRAAFRRRDVGRHDDFFDIGGHSLMAVRLTKRLEEHFGQIVPLDALWAEAGTIEGMAALIRRRGDPDPQSRLVPLQAGSVAADPLAGTRPPLFVLHTLRGSVNEYYAFASHFGAEQRVIGVRSRGLVDDGEPPADIFGFARDCVDAIRREYPRGPYLLAGCSIGGLIAYEAAVLLTQRGQRVAFLGLFDTPSPGYVPSQPDVPALKAKWDRLRRRARRKLEPLRELVGSLTRSNEIGVGGTHPSQVSKHSMALYRALISAERKHVASASATVPVDLFLPSRAVCLEPDKTLGWERVLSAGIRCHVVAAGDHDDMMKADHVRSLALAVDACLRELGRGVARSKLPSMSMTSANNFAAKK